MSPSKKEDHRKVLEREGEKDCPQVEETRTDASLEAPESLQEEKDRVAAIATACFIGDQEKARVRVRSVRVVDPDDEWVPILAAACLAGDQTGVRYRVHSVCRIK